MGIADVASGEQGEATAFSRYLLGRAGEERARVKSSGLHPNSSHHHWWGCVPIQASSHGYVEAFSALCFAHWDMVVVGGWQAKGGGRETEAGEGLGKGKV